jgi:hypothetical protein
MPNKKHSIRYPMIKPFFDYSTDVNRQKNNSHIIIDKFLSPRRNSIGAYRELDSTAKRNPSCSIYQSMDSYNFNSSADPFAKDKLLSRKASIPNFCKSLPRDDRYTNPRPESKGPTSSISPRVIQSGFMQLLGKNTKVAKVFDRDYLENKVQQKRKNWYNSQVVA